MAAFFTKKQGGTINVLKLMKLLYLSDRESMSRCGMPITFDSMVSMPKGPVLSRSLNLTSGQADSQSQAQWEEWLSDRENHNINVIRDFSRADLDELSNADLDVLESIWADFGRMHKYEISDWTHVNCPEWTDPHGSSLPIDEAEVLMRLGREPKEAEQLAQAIRDERELDRVFAAL